MRQLSIAFATDLPVTPNLDQLANQGFGVR